MSETIQTKQCSKCKQIKPISEFYKDRRKKDGYRSHCKVCMKHYRQTEQGKAVQKRHKQSKKGKIAAKRYQQSEKGKATDKCYRQSVKGKANSGRYQKSEKGKANKRRYNRSPKGRTAQKRDYIRLTLSAPKKVKARIAVNNAIKTGKLPRPNTLSCHYYLQNPDCDWHAQQYHHWHGYEPEHQLDVIPVCQDCHTKCSPTKKSAPQVAYMESHNEYEVSGLQRHS